VSGFDRLVFRGSLQRLNYGYYEPGLKAMVAKGMEEYLWQNKIPFKDYQDHVKQISERLKKASLEPLEKQKIPVVFLRYPSADKNLTAREIASEKGIASGPVCVLSTLEPSPTFEHRGKHIIRRMRGGWRSWPVSTAGRSVLMAERSCCVRSTSDSTCWRVSRIVFWTAGISR